MNMGSGGRWAEAKRTYALADFTVDGKLTNGSFGKRPGKAKEERRGPYSSIASVTLMIARQLKKDITKRVAAH